jgi:N-acetylglutamate synthase-like GNAT family acetyltransferase
MTKPISHRTPAWTIRAAAPDDLKSARDLIAACELPLGGVEQSFGDGYAVAEERGELVAVAGVEVHGRFGLLRSVAVSARLRGEGIGAALVRDRLAWSQAKGLAALYLLTTSADR